MNSAHPELSDPAAPRSRKISYLSFERRPAIPSRPQRPMATTQFWPPNPKALTSMVSTVIARLTLGT